MITNEDHFLLQKLKEGDIHALEVIFNKHYSNLTRYLQLLFKNELLVEHIAQDIFIYLWENRENLQIKSSLEAYIYTAGRYKALNQLRNNKLQESIREKISSSSTSEQYEIDQDIENHELKGLIDHAISMLAPRCQQIFRLSREQEMTYKEIADFLDISVNTVEGQMAIALKKLRLTLKPFYLKIFFIA
ncbi:MAG: RNA polymerase sigma-70 factor [Lentimicrobium sp.]|jgi:RNA polymerase sigma-70 factor (ECF subfamily)|nr:RNA polymerase sigma-70 factor [Lentimicrobium sp.]